MAEALLKAKYPDKTIISAGIRAMTGFPADSFSVQVMQENGLDIRQHRAQQITNEMIQSSDLILTMEAKQTHYIETYRPAFKGKVMRIGEYRHFDVPDPYMQGINSFRSAFRLISDGLDDIAERVLL